MTVLRKIFLIFVTAILPCSVRAQLNSLYGDIPLDEMTKNIKRLHVATIQKVTGHGTHVMSLKLDTSGRTTYFQADLNNVIDSTLFDTFGRINIQIRIGNSGIISKTIREYKDSLPVAIADYDITKAGEKTLVNSYKYFKSGDTSVTLTTTSWGQRSGTRTYNVANVMYVQLDDTIKSSGNATRRILYFIPDSVYEKKHHEKRYLENGEIDLKKAGEDALTATLEKLAKNPKGHTMADLESEQTDNEIKKAFNSLIFTTPYRQPYSRPQYDSNKDERMIANLADIGYHQITYSYDAVGRIEKSEEKGNMFLKTTTYKYSENGLITSLDMAGNNAEHADFTYTYFTQ